MVDASSLAANGPVKQEPTKRRIRAQLGNQWVVDTLDAVYVWEHKYYPMYYVPTAAIKESSATITRDAAGTSNGFETGRIAVDDTSAEAIFFETGPLAGLTRLDGVDWYAEEEKLLGPHPKDPYVRIECLNSSRPVRVELHGVVLAESTNSMFLHETNLRTRYYLTPTTANLAYLRPSKTTTYCPYKGKASYYDVVLPDGTVVADGVWYYPFPTHESAAIQGRLSFYNEKFDVFVDGIKEDK